MAAQYKVSSTMAFGSLTWKVEFNCCDVRSPCRFRYMPPRCIRIFCQVPYLASGKTDPIARTVIETYVTRLTHEKYAGTYNKVLNSLKNMFAAKPDSGNDRRKAML